LNRSSRRDRSIRIISLDGPPGVGWNSDAAFASMSKRSESIQPGPPRTRERIIACESATENPVAMRPNSGAFVTTSGPRQRYDMAERCVRGFFKWVGVKWEETIAFVHDDVDSGSVAGRASDLMIRAHALGRRLAESPPLVPEPAPHP